MTCGYSGSETTLHDTAQSRLNEVASSHTSRLYACVCVRICCIEVVSGSEHFTPTRGILNGGTQRVLARQFVCSAACNLREATARTFTHGKAHERTLGATLLAERLAAQMTIHKVRLEPEQQRLGHERTLASAALRSRLHAILRHDARAQLLRNDAQNLLDLDLLQPFDLEKLPADSTIHRDKHSFGARVNVDHRLHSAC